jgi:polar amino acid transport system permease protein
MTFSPASEARQTSSIELGRRAFRRRQGARSVVISLVSTVVFAGVVWFTLINTPGWAAVQNTYLDPAHFVTAWPRVIAGFVVNLRILFFAVIGVAVFASLLAIIRTLRGAIFFPLRVLATAYTDLFRGLPLIIVLYLVGFGIPGLRLTETRIPAEVLGTVALILTYSAYVSEVLRAGIEAVHPSQRLAARSLGLSHGQTLRMVILPQAIRKMTPALLNDFVSMQKDVGLVSVLGVIDAVRAAQIETATDFNYSSYVLAGLLFVLLALPMIRFTDWYSARLRDREQIGSIV